jgi:hypothetical protein
MCGVDPLTIMSRSALAGLYMYSGLVGSLLLSSWVLIFRFGFVQLTTPPSWRLFSAISLARRFVVSLFVVCVMFSLFSAVSGSGVRGVFLVRDVCSVFSVRGMFFFSVFDCF